MAAHLHRPIKKLLSNCRDCRTKRRRPAHPQGTLTKVMDFNDILTMDLKELIPVHSTGWYKYILYMIDEFSKYTKAVLIRDKEADTVIFAMYKH